MSPARTTCVPADGAAAPVPPALLPPSCRTWPSRIVSPVRPFSALSALTVVPCSFASSHSVSPGRTVIAPGACAETTTARASSRPRLPVARRRPRRAVGEAERVIRAPDRSAARSDVRATVRRCDWCDKRGSSDGRVDRWTTPLSFATRRRAARRVLPRAARRAPCGGGARRRRRSRARRCPQRPGAARPGLRRAGRAAGGGAAPALRPAAAVEGGPARQGRREPARRVLGRARRRPAAVAPRRPRCGRGR